MQTDRTLALKQLRELMKRDGIDAMIIPSSDPHISEYLPESYRYISWLSGFTGSAGTLVITAVFAGLWTDSRYFVQAEAEFKDTEWELVPLTIQGRPEYVDWLFQRIDADGSIAFDFQVMPLLIAKEIHAKCQAKGIQVKHSDILNEVWTNRPELPAEKAYCISEDLCGESTADKLSRIRSAIKQAGASHHLISSLDDIAWVFNIRGADISYNPVVLAFALISLDEVLLFLDDGKFSEADRRKLTASGVHLKPYSSLQLNLKGLAGSAVLLIDPQRTAKGTMTGLNKSIKIIENTNPSTYFKAIKNRTELDNILTVMRNDGVALVRFFRWLEKEVPGPGITEVSAARKLMELRAQNPNFVSNSFATISAYGPNGALPHYRPNEENPVLLKDYGLYLVDSGGQYLDGTTDVTRVIPLGRISNEEMLDYTLVLKAMVEGCSTIYPKGTRGYQIDAITRKPLWDQSRDYGHGTGHGVGFFLNVHEGPHVFNKSNVAIEIEPGMITSIEPGLYRPGKYGIRIENLVLSVPYIKSEFGEFYSFETLTLAPIDTRPVIKGMLEKRHIDWINSYNKNVYTILSPLLTDEERGWLRKKTMEI
ncbi:aminopeptidase P family protein [Desertivirga arenae]|uniref:aminopeptidase P family protein n=1 Tax=Desertivirga arenae TaxID=2810309 RepID=UPI001A979679|nr:aminopeptidase P family protein [Pedobacter sp. SYSU D00823]